MNMIEINWRPADRQLRQFGAICLFALPAVAWLWGGGAVTVIVLGVLGFVLSIVGLVAPVVLKPLFIALTIAATPIGIVVGELAMLLIYFGIFMPLGLVFRLAKRDFLQLGFARHKDSYWEPKKQPANVASYYRQS